MKAGTVEINRIHQGDSIELLKQLPENSMDLIFADPPYNLQLKGDLFRPDQSKVSAVNDHWDKFGSFKSYDEFTGAWLRECHRVIKNTGSIWVIGTYHNIFRVGSVLQDTGFWILNDIIWIKTNPMPNFMGTRFNNAHETLIWATKSKASKYTFHYRTMKGFNDDLQMRSDWLIPICQGAERLRENGQKAHSTQKPEELLYRIILATSNQGDLVLDPFAGTGTTAAVAKKLGRNFIGFEREATYVRLARERVGKITPLNKSLLEYRTERRLPRVSFGNLVAAGHIRVGEHLWTADRKFSAEVQADSSLVCKDMTGSIHSLGTLVSGREGTNGWSYWHAEREGMLVCIDDLRKDFRK
ncbi:MAG TPA: site-specific DNA-methyltransferase [Bacteroidales bacterium]|nr:site-specific DNA-methyltransferase [Bacteroidales bacterium]